MAMSTYLQSVSPDELAALERDPSGINALDQTVWMSTHLGPTLNYFIAGSAYPEAGSHPLAAMLDGSRSVPAPTLENAYFHVVETHEVAGIVTALEAVDPDALRAAIESADFGDLIDEEELYELELMAEDEVSPAVLDDLGRLIAFYRRVAEAGNAVVSYTT